MQGNDTNLKMVREAAASLSVPVFLATMNAKNAVTFHTTYTNSKGQLNKEIRKSDLGLPFSVAGYPYEKLEKHTSLEDMANIIGKDTIAYDPTGVFSRMNALVEFSSNIRKELGKKLTGVYLESEQRVTYIVLNLKSYLSNDSFSKEELAAAEKVIMQQAATLFEGDQSFINAIRIGFTLPNCLVAPVDKASLKQSKKVKKIVLSKQASAALAVLLGCTTMQGAAAEPAVSELNGKISGAAGVIEEEGFGLVAGAVSAPLPDTRFTKNLGVQGDVALGSEDGESVWAVAGHLFHRDPNKHLLGLVASHSDKDDLELQRYGLEGELYLKNYTVSAELGGQFGDNNEGAYGNIEFGWYYNPNLLAAIGGEFADEDTVGFLKVEYQPTMKAMSGLTLFAEGMIGDDHKDGVFAGVRFYFHKDKSRSLIDRHRKDDPQNRAASHLTRGLSGEDDEAETKEEEEQCGYGGCD